VNISLILDIDICFGFFGYIFGFGCYGYVLDVMDVMDIWFLCRKFYFQVFNWKTKKIALRYNLAAANFPGNSSRRSQKYTLLRRDFSKTQYIVAAATYIIRRGEIFHNGTTVPLWNISPRRVRNVAAARNDKHNISLPPRPRMTLAAANYSTMIQPYRCGNVRRGEIDTWPRRMLKKLIHFSQRDCPVVENGCFHNGTIPLWNP